MEQIEKDFYKYCSRFESCNLCKYRNFDKCESVFGYEQGMNKVLCELLEGKIRTVSINDEYFITLDELKARISQIKTNLGIVEGK